MRDDGTSRSGDPQEVRVGSIASCRLKIERGRIPVPRDSGAGYVPTDGDHDIDASLDEWRSWTGLDFSATGPVHVSGALVPVQCDVRHGIAVYVEPNVWVRHDLT